MARVFHSLEGLIGNTPLLEITRVHGAQSSPRARILAKLEYVNPTGSIKDRAALGMIRDALARGLLAPGGTVIEPTSGNTGIGLAALAAAKGFHAVIVMPDSMSEERIRLMRAYGADVVLTPGALGMAGAVSEAQRLHDETPGSLIAGQFDNPANADAHYRTTGPEIFADTDGALDIFLATVGTGGTLTGCARYLKEKNPALRVIAVEPAASPLLSGGKAGPHAIQGIGANFVPAVLDRSQIDEVITVTDEDARAATRALAEREGLLVGISSGAALSAALSVAARPENIGKTLVTVFPDSGNRYLSDPVFGGSGAEQ